MMNSIIKFLIGLISLVFLLSSVVFATENSDDFMNISILSPFGNDLTKKADVVDNSKKAENKDISINDKEISSLLKINYGNTLGSSSSKIAVFYFFSYNNQNCKKLDTFMQNLVSGNSDLKVVFIDTSFDSATSIDNYIIRVAIASSLQDKYIDVRKALITSKHMLLHKDQILDLVKSAGVNVSQLNKDINSEKVLSILENNNKITKDCGIKTVPFCIISYTSEPYSQIAFVDETGDTNLIKYKLYEFFQK